MVDEKENLKISKFLSLVLRHQPGIIGIQLDDSGWTDVGDLLEKTKAHGISISHEILTFIVENNSKKRFAFNDDLTKIRASQGHSIAIDLGYVAETPPSVLYHGTAQHAIESIRLTGLEKRGRHHVHMSTDMKTALSVGQRYGKAVVLEINAGAMKEHGHLFYRAENNVWLTDHVPVTYLMINGSELE